jgi:hypothetical protein
VLQPGLGIVLAATLANQGEGLLGVLGHILAKGMPVTQLDLINPQLRYVNISRLDTAHFGGELVKCLQVLTGTVGPELTLQSRAGVTIRRDY